MAADTPSTNFDFGVVIAFIAPGFLAFHAASYHFPTADAWMSAVSDKDQSVGLFLFVLLASLSLGLVVSGIRALMIDTLICWSFLGKFAVPRSTLDWSRIDEKNLPVLLAIRDNHYRYYQFYANTLVAMVLWMLARGSSSMPALSWPKWTLMLVATAALFLSARDALNRYGAALGKL
jgi:hypothetical protein